MAEKSTSYGRLLGGDGIFPSEFLDIVHHIDMFLQQIKWLERSAMTVIEGENRRRKWLALSEGLTTFAGGLSTAGSCRGPGPYMKITRMAETVKTVSEKWGDLEKNLRRAVIEPLQALREKKNVKGFYQYMEELDKIREKHENSVHHPDADIPNRVRLECYRNKLWFEQFAEDCLKELEEFKDIAPQWRPYEIYFNNDAADLLQPYFRIPWEMKKREVKEEEREVPYYTPFDGVRKKGVADMGIVAMPPPMEKKKMFRGNFFKSSKKDEEETSDEPKSHRSIFKRKKKVAPAPVELPSDWHSFTSPKSGEDSDSD